MSSSTTLEDPSSQTAALAMALEATSLNDAAQPPQNHPENPPASTSSPRPLTIYTRAQLLNLYRSPLVQPPPEMPELKSWFGIENEQNLSKRDSDLSTPSGSRDRRFRRDYEDGETPPRPTFRSTLTQPSQMGNFKHQSLRDRDKDRDRDGEKERERDIRDREGQDRLRHLSDKYDRDRLALSSSNARTKDRDGGSSSRAAQSQVSGNGARRGEPRDPSKRKFTESGDDWRRGDNPRSTREDRSDTIRRDRSRPRDSSRSHPEPPSRRSERDDGRDRPTRDRDDDDDPRHWRDDGKRDERVALRKARERGGDHWEPSTDRRWAATEERDGRYKRNAGRDRRNGTQEERDREDRKEREREREREKEKEPAWMEADVPNEPMSGILGGGSATGELDGIQAWKKGLKDKEKDEKDSRPAISEGEQTPAPSANGEKQPSDNKTPSQPLDEIQMFRLMMQKEKEKRDFEPTGASPVMSSKPVSVESSQTEGVRKAEPEQPSANPRLDNEAPSPASADTGGTRQPTSSVPVSASGVLSAEKAASDSLSQFNPPVGPRLLALGRGANKAAAIQSPVPVNAPSMNNELSRGQPGFSPFEEAAHQSRAFIDRVPPNIPPHAEGLQRMPADRSPLNQHPQFNPGVVDHSQADPNSNGYAASKGSRFAKFFDGKTKEQPPPAAPKPQMPIGFTSPSPNLAPRFDQGGYNPSSNSEEPRTMEDIIAMLANSQAHRTAQNATMGGGLSSLPQSSPFNGHPHPIQHQHHQLANRSESLYDSRLDDRSFVPDGMVPGLRTAPPPRSRDYVDSIDDPMVHLQRLAHQQQLQHRHDPNFGGGASPMFSQQTRGMALSTPQQPYRGGPSPNSAQQHGLPPSQRLPPGLANLGSRPPHDATQFLGLLGGPNGPQMAALSNNGLLPQQFNNMNQPNPGNLSYANNQQFRGPAPSLNVQTSGGQLPLGNLSQNNIDPRLSAANFGHGLGGVGQRVVPNSVVPPQQQRLGPQHLGMIQQQQQQRSQLPPHMLPPMHHPNGQNLQGPTSQAQDLMALLMGGAMRE